MLHRDIIIKWQGKNVDYDGVYGFQCVDWVRKYCEERGYPIKSFGGSAINGWITGSPFDDTWIRFPYKEGMYPHQGDLIFFDESRCKFGHVSIANKHCNPNILRHTDQNGTGKQDKIQPRFSDYKNVIGFYSKIGQ